MSGNEDFLSRWSRRKRSAEESAQTAEPLAAKLSPQPASGVEKSEQSDEAEFDLSTLPSLDSITSGTDMSVFMQKGVPLDLTRAALRRAWSADPTIRDFIGLAENAWDFNDPNAMHGFGPLDHSPEEVRQMLAHVMGEVRRIAEPNIQSENSLSNSGIAQDSNHLEHRNEQLSSVEYTAEKCCALPSRSKQDETTEDFAAQHVEVGEEESVAVMRRAHGGALPK
jgi:hypothetical protein